MEQAIFIAKWLLANYQAIITATVAVLTALIGLFVLIPGDEPETFLKKCLDFITQWSRKPAEPKE